ncbi:MAG: hypothetical protein ACLT8E_07840 [Akkermansia sp.]
MEDDASAGMNPVWSGTWPSPATPSFNAGGRHPDRSARPQPEGNVHENITITGNTFDLRNGTAIRTHHTGSVKAENTFTKDGKNIPAEKAVDIGREPPTRGAVKRTVTETLSVRGRMNLRRVTIT